MSSLFSRPLTNAIAQPARRRFVQGLVAGGAVASLGWPGRGHASTGDAPVLTGPRFNLSIGEMPVNFTGRRATAVAVNGSLPAPVLRWREGTTVQLDVTNALPADTIHGHHTSIHWHGLILPANMDGVPGISFNGIQRGETYPYRFDVRQSGTYWYHAHSGFQEQAGVYGAIVIDPIAPPPYRIDREHVVLLSDWTDLDPAALYERLKKMPEHDNYYLPTVGDFLRDASADGLAATLRDRQAWGRMRMTPTDLSDVNANTYTYLMNGNTSGSNWTGLFRSGERVLLRLINGSSMTHFDVRIPGLKLTVVAADGLYVRPVTVDELRIAAAETYDVIVEPSGQDAFTIFAQDLGRTGFVRGTLATRPGLQAPVPRVDPRPMLTMDDMGHGGHGGHAGHVAAAATGPAQGAGSDTQHAGMDHAAMGHVPAADGEHAAMGHGVGGM